MNTVVVNAGTEIWVDRDRIAFNSGSNGQSTMPDFAAQFQTYLNENKRALFGTTYAVGVLISNNSLVQGGYSQGPPCTTSGQ